jgi:hypothetical protein
VTDRQAHDVFLSVVGIAAKHLTESQGCPPNSLFLRVAGSVTLRRDEFSGVQAAGHKPMLNLREVVDRYLAVTPSFGQPVALSAFQLSPTETQILFSILDEDYHLSRFLHFSNIAGEAYVISGEAVTHLSIDPAIQSIL